MSNNTTTLKCKSGSTRQRGNWYFESFENFMSCLSICCRRSMLLVDAMRHCLNAAVVAHFVVCQIT